MVVKVYRHFDQVKRVEKSPNAKQYYPRFIRFTLQRLRFLSVLVFPFSRVFYRLYSTHLIAPKDLLSCTRFSVLNSNDFAILLHLINLVCSNDTTFLLHSFCLIFPNGSPNVLSIYPLSPQSNSPILFLISSPSLHPSFLSPHYFYLLSFYLRLL